MATRRVPAVGAVITNDDDQILLIQRAHEPGRGLWSLPGGRVEPGESAEIAIIREVAEETGLNVRVVGEVGSVDITALPDLVFEVRDFRCSVIGGVMRAGDDAADIRWVNQDELAAMETSIGLVEHLHEWGAFDG